MIDKAKKTITIEPEHLKIGDIDPKKQALINKIDQRCPFYMYSQAKAITQAELYP